MDLKKRFHDRPLDELHTKRMKQHMWEEIQKQHAMKKRTWNPFANFAGLSRYASVAFAAVFVVVASLVAPNFTGQVDQPSAFASFELIPNSTNIAGVGEDVTSFTLVASEEMSVETLAKSIEFYPKTDFEVVRSGRTEFQIILKEEPQSEVQYTMSIIPPGQTEEVAAAFSWTYEASKEEEDLEIIDEVLPVRPSVAVENTTIAYETEVVKNSQFNSIYQSFVEELEEFHEVKEEFIKTEEPESKKDQFISKYSNLCSVGRSYDEGQLTEVHSGSIVDGKLNGQAYYVFKGASYYGEGSYQEIFAESGSTVRNAGVYSQVYLKEGARLRESYGNATIYFENADDIDQWYDDVSYVSCGSIEWELSWVPEEEGVVIEEPDVVVSNPVVSPTISATSTYTAPTEVLPAVEPVISSPVVTAPIQETVKWVTYWSPNDDFSLEYPSDWDWELDGANQRFLLKSPEWDKYSTDADFTIRWWDSWEEASKELGHSYKSVEEWVESGKFNYLQPWSMEKVKLGGAYGYIGRSHYDNSYIYLLEYDGRWYEVDYNSIVYDADKLEVLDSLSFF